MEKDEKVENSRKNESTDEEKPLKKARYLWEVKGKGHLKTPKEGCSSKDSTSKSVRDNLKSEKPGSSKLESSSDSHKDGCGRSNSPSVEFKSCCLTAFIAEAESIMDKDSSEDEDSQKLPLENSIENEIPVTLVSAQPKDYDYYLQKWQARQIARGFVDNTINSMLENYIDHSFDATNLVEEAENDGQVEDDAILMAIQSHGLQSGWRASRNNNTTNSNLNDCSSITGGSNNARNLIPVTTDSNQLFQQSSTDNFENLQKDNENDTSSLASSTSSVSADTASSISNPFENGLGDPMDFLNAAVSVAIQKKGLTYG